MSLMKKQSLSLSSLIVIIFFFLISLFFFERTPYVISGKAEVVDGDTIKINGTKIRLFGIDAPELKQKCRKKSGESYLCGKFSKGMLDFIESQDVTVRCEYSKKDKYGRILGICFTPRKDLNKWMVQTGAAVAYKRYSKKYLADEEYARDKKFGIWSGDFIRPEEWRKKK